MAGSWNGESGIRKEARGEERTGERQEARTCHVEEGIKEDSPLLLLFSKSFFSTYCVQTFFPHVTVHTCLPIHLGSQG